MTTSRLPCPCCGYLIFIEGPGSYDVCPICFWEDDAVQLEFATDGGGANAVHLLDAQRNFASLGACEPRFVGAARPPAAIDGRDPDWRPIDLDRDHFERLGSTACLRAPAHDEALYYWRDTFWRRHR